MDEMVEIITKIITEDEILKDKVSFEVFDSTKPHSFIDQVLLCQKAGRTYFYIKRLYVMYSV